MTEKRKRKMVIKRRAECESCGFKTKLKRYSDGYDSKGPINPIFCCDLCAHIHKVHDHDAKVLQRTIIYVANAILKRVQLLLEKGNP